jgi:hypothetical protein
MFEQLKNFKRVLVTGPQRSGTTICGKMLAHDLGLPYVDEMEVIIGYNLRTEREQSFRDWLKSRVGRRFEEEIVLQCPSAASFCHELDRRVAIVFMIRPVHEILASQKRIDWGHEQHELRQYGATSGPIAEVKYNHWAEQKKNGDNFFEVKFDSLSKHPLWVPPELRKMFRDKQTEFFPYF